MRAAAVLWRLCWREGGRQTRRDISSSARAEHAPRYKKTTASSRQDAGATTPGCRLFALQRFQLFEGARPVVAEEARKAAVGEEFSAGLALGAVVGFFVGVADTLDFFAAARAGLAEFSVGGHLGAERGPLFRKIFFCFGS